MEKRKMGQSGESSSILGFGCMRLPLNGPTPDKIDVELATQMLRLAIDRGVNYVDTAYAYHSAGTRNTPGQSEPFVGEALKGGYREKVLLATKLPTWLVESHRDMHRFLDEQLMRLNTKQLDFYLAHNLNVHVWDKMLSLKLFDFFEEAMKDGRIRFPAFSFHDSYPLFETIVKSYDWALSQIQYNYLDQEYQAGKKGLKIAASRGLAVVIMEPLRGGFLGRYIPEPLVNKLEGLHPEWSMAGWALKWLWAQNEVSTVLSGMSDMSQVEDNLKSAEEFGETGFGEDDALAIDQVGEYFAKRIKVDCTQCGYCMPCPSGVDIPKNLSFLNQYHLFDAKETKERCKFYYAVMLAASERAIHCTQCGECLEKCPQNIPIPESLAQTADLYSSVK
ncbi:MAG: aldo/keto reductase [Deltaproteobacteria bacterium]|nr:aldo/keto reductase [Deltaproteobacteria bacterium]